MPLYVHRSNAKRLAGLGRWFPWGSKENGLQRRVRRDGVFVCQECHWVVTVELEHYRQGFPVPEAVSVKPWPVCADHGNTMQLERTVLIAK